MVKEDFETLKKKAKLLAEVATILNTEETHVPKVIERFQKEIEEMKAGSKK